MDTNPDIERIVGSAYELHRPDLWRYLTSLTHDAVVAEDLAQDAFLRLTVEAHAGRLPEDVGAWLHRVGHNLAMSRGRRLTVADRHRSELAMPDQPPSPEQVVLAEERNSAVAAVLDELEPVQRQALVMASMGFGGPEIARWIGRTDGATRTMLCRTRAKVRADLAPQAV
jgi:RNA polymerase sigma-70 factor, ECF subfamily